jgi:hypothetical protein
MSRLKSDKMATPRCLLLNAYKIKIWKDTRDNLVLIPNFPDKGIGQQNLKDLLSKWAKL